MVTNIKQYLQPIDKVNKTGLDLRFRPEFNKIETKREQLQEQINLKNVSKEKREKEWKQIQDLCHKILIDESKDLQIAVWLTESLFALKGFKGLEEGLNIIIELCQKYWENLFPLINDGDYEFRMKPFAWLNYKFIERLHDIPICKPYNSLSDKEYTYLDKLTIKKYNKSQEMINLRHLQTKTPIKFFQTHNKDIVRITKTLSQLQKIINNLCDKKEDNTFYLLNNHLNKISLNFKTIIDKKSPKTKNKQKDSISYGLQIDNRFQAYEYLQIIADFLAKIEPHSPTPYLLKKAISWGDKPFDELLIEISKEQPSFATLMTNLGIDIKKNVVEQKTINTLPPTQEPNES